MSRSSVLWQGRIVVDNDIVHPETNMIRLLRKVQERQNFHFQLIAGRIDIPQPKVQIDFAPAYSQFLKRAKCHQESSFFCYPRLR